MSFLPRGPGLELAKDVLTHNEEGAAEQGSDNEVICKVPRRQYQTTIQDSDKEETEPVTTLANFAIIIITAVISKSKAPKKVSKK